MKKQKIVAKKAAGQVKTKLVLADVNVVFPGHGGAESVQALSNINLTLQGNDFTVVLGSSGCGKTTLLSLIAGFIKPNSGELFFERTLAETDSAMPKKQKITVDGPSRDRGVVFQAVEGPSRDRGVVFQKHALLPWLSVLDNVEFPLKLRSVSKKERFQEALKNLKLMGLEDFLNHKVYELSGGMQQRVGIARALTADPSVLLMDEPLGALDALTRENVQQIILKGWLATGKMIFFITHSVEEALFIGTRLIVMSPRPGRITHEFPLDFSEEFLSGKTARVVKSSPRFIKMREKILDIIYRDEGLIK